MLKQCCTEMNLEELVRNKMNFSQNRYERKFLCSNIEPDQIFSLIKLHNLNFSEIYSERKINNIYYDTIDLNSFYDNIDGLAKRRKVRLRWYGENLSVIDNPTLEVKLKDSLVGKKGSLKINKSYKLNDIIQGDLFSMIDNKLDYYTRSLYLSCLKPSLINTYYRRYFISFCKKFRITVDSNQSFYSPFNIRNLANPSISDNENLIIEVKYDTNFDDSIDFVSQSLPFRMTKSSKYVDGIYRLLLRF